VLQDCFRAEVVEGKARTDLDKHVLDSTGFVVLAHTWVVEEMEAGWRPTR
jgi:hypothetical protein